MEFELVDEISVSRTTEVWKAYNASLELPLCCKIFSPSMDIEPDEAHNFERLFYNEAELLARLQHPSIIRFYSFSTTKIRGIRCPTIIMEFAQGKHLNEITLDASHACMVATKVLSVIAYLQNPKNIGQRYYKHIHHGDIKPSNILITKDGLRLIDFGYSCPDPALDAESILGTPRYISPSKLAGKPLTWRDDAYALGLSVLEGMGLIQPTQGIVPELTTEIRKDKQLNAIWGLISNAYESPNAAIAAIAPLVEAKNFDKELGHLLR